MEYMYMILDILAIIGGTAVIAASPAAPLFAAIPTIKKIIDVIGMNIGEAKNEKK